MFLVLYSFYLMLCNFHSNVYWMFEENMSNKAKSEKSFTKWKYFSIFVRQCSYFDLLVYWLGYSTTLVLLISVRAKLSLISGNFTTNLKWCQSCVTKPEHDGVRHWRYRGKNKLGGDTKTRAIGTRLPS